MPVGRSRQGSRGWVVPNYLRSASASADPVAVEIFLAVPCPRHPRIKAISSECGAILAPHFRAADGSLLRPARGQLHYHYQTVGKERRDIGRHSHKASRAPRSSGNGLPREPAADVAGERLPDYRRECVYMTSFPQCGRNMKTGQAIARRSRGNLPNPSIEGSIWSRRGNRWPRAFSVQSFSTRSTSRR
jgi:hypothetical protein